MKITAPKPPLALAGIGLAIAVTTGMAFAHVDDEKAKELSQPNPGGGIAGGDFDALNVTLAAHLLPGDFDTGASYASDCWGYTSPSGREYAIVGLRTGMAFVDITVPTEPEIIHAYEWVQCVWYDMKVFQHYAYIVNDCQQGMVVLDLSQIDDGTIAIASVDTYPTSSHNVVIDTTSGYLYRTGGGANGLVIYDLNANPAEPQLVGTWSERYVHDAWAHTYTDGPYAGHEIVICNGGFNGGWVEPGIDVLDVTDKDDIVLLDRYIYPGGEYSHQGCLSADGLYYYMGDEGDEGNGVTTTSLIIDMSDLENLTLVDTFTTGLPAIDHNQYVRGNLIFQANYTTGLRIFDASNPLAPVEVGYFDTVPANDNVGYAGLWSNFPYFPSGTVIGSGSGGLWIWTLDLETDTCAADTNSDGTVDVEDLVAVIVDWGCLGECAGDVNGDLVVDVTDLVEVILAWGDCQ